MKRYILLTFVLVMAAASGAAAQERPKGISLPAGLLLNGKFDVAYERAGYNSNLADGKNALKNYHHFVFLSRETKDDPFFFTSEIIERYFYEFGARFRLAETPVHYSVRAGKLVVPFGGEPIFHHSYGGLSGLDQKVLPTVWSQHGAAAQVQYRGAGWMVSNDMYAVQGYALPESDAVLGLQADFSESDDIKVGYGNRLSLGYGPVALWYSIYGNPLGFGRLLFMQALDFSVWRPDFPIADRLALSAGILRADVSGGEDEGTGGYGKDYYHFADYVQLRVYPFDWLYIEGRTGLTTKDNRGGVYIDDDRLDASDQSAHTIGAVYRRNQFMLEVRHFWLYEKRDEVANDFLRVRAGYEF